MKSAKLKAPQQLPLAEPEVLEILVGMVEVGINPALKIYGRSVGEFFKFLQVRGDLMDVYLANQQTRAEVLADEIVHIADHERSFDRAKIKISARQWFASRILHRKYGDKLSVDHNHTVDLRGSIEEAKKRAALVVQSSPVAIPRIAMPSADPNYNEAMDRLAAARATGVNVPPPREDEDLVSWGEKIVDALPFEAQPIIEDDLDNPD